MVCERCGNEITSNTIICPACGTATMSVKDMAQPPTSYGQHPRVEEPPSYQQSYPARETPSYQRGYAPQPVVQQPAQQQPGYTPPYQAVPLYAQEPFGIPGPNRITVSNKNDSALLIEIILSLFGIFGVGWLIAGEITTGIILILCSFFIYWPILIIGTIFTFGIGLLCLGPLAIGCIILNTVLLNGVLNRKATQFVVMPPPPMSNPPQ